MSLGDVSILYPTAFGPSGARKFGVSAGTTASIKAGELVLKALGGTNVTVWTAGSAVKPSVGTDFLAGLSTSTSTETTTLAGTVDVLPIVPGVVYLIDPNNSALFDTQTEYDNLVGTRVFLDCTSGGVQTILASSHVDGGLVIEPLNIAEHPGKVAFSLRAGLSYLA